MFLLYCGSFQSLLVMLYFLVLKTSDFKPFSESKLRQLCL